MVQSLLRRQNVCRKIRSPNHHILIGKVLCFLRMRGEFKYDQTHRKSLRIAEIFTDFIAKFKSGNDVRFMMESWRWSP